MPTARPAALLLDFNGTLFEETPPRHAIYAAAARARGIEVEADRMRDAMRAAHAELPRTIDGQFRYTERWFRAFIESVFARVGAGPIAAPGALDALADELLATFSRKDTFRPFPEVRAVIKRLKGAAVPLAVVSNWGPRLPVILALHGLERDFDAIVASALVKIEKPDAAIFRRAAALLGVAPERCLHVGDDPTNDRDGARSAGMSALLLDRAVTAGTRDAERIATLNEVLPRFEIAPI